MSDKKDKGWNADMGEQKKKKRSKKKVTELNDCSGAGPAGHLRPRKERKKPIKQKDPLATSGAGNPGRKRKRPIKSVVDKFPDGWRKKKPRGSNYPQDGPNFSALSSTEEEDDEDDEEEDDQEGLNFTQLSSTEEEEDDEKEGPQFSPVLSTDEEVEQEDVKYSPKSSTRQNTGRGTRAHSCWGSNYLDTAEEEKQLKEPIFSPITSTEEVKPLAVIEFSSEKQRKVKPVSKTKFEVENLGDWVGCSLDANFTLHTISVNAGEDVTMKIISYSQQGPRAICILSANGVISSVTLNQPDSSGGTLTYEGGSFEILSLSGSYVVSETGGAARRSRSGGMCVSLASPDGRVVGGRVAGVLVAASPVQVVVGSFVAHA